jgi:hypothetical protein
MTEFSEAEFKEADLAPNTTLPPNLQLIIRDLGNDQEWNGRFRDALVDVIIACGRYMDLRLLDGVTVGFGYQEALDSVDLGRESAIEKRFTNLEEAVGVGKLLRVRRDGRRMGHVVIDGNYLDALVEPESAAFESSLNVMVHELAHVAILGWFEKHSPGIMLQPFQSCWLKGQLQDVANTIWEEYAACRLCLGIGGSAVEGNYIDIVERAAASGFSQARNHIKDYRVHGNVSQVFVDVAASIGNPLKYAAYLLGHLEGAAIEPDFSERCPVWSGSEFAEFHGLLLGALRRAWDTREEWGGLGGVDEIVEVIVGSFVKLGVHITFGDKDTPDRLDIPWRDDTIPDE